MDGSVQIDVPNSCRSRDPFRGVSRVEIPKRYSSPRERALAETAVPAWPRLLGAPVPAPPAKPAVVRLALGLLRVVAGLLLVFALFGLSLILAACAAFLADCHMITASLACAVLGLVDVYSALQLLRWTVHGPDAPAPKRG